MKLIRIRPSLQSEVLKTICRASRGRPGGAIPGSTCAIGENRSRNRFSRDDLMLCSRPPASPEEPGFGIVRGPSFWTHSVITCTSRRLPRLLNRAFAGLLHAFHAVGIDRHQAVCHRTAAAQGHTKVMYGIGGELRCGELTFLRTRRIQ